MSSSEPSVPWDVPRRTALRTPARSILTLWVFVLVLAFSRAIFAELVFDLSVHSLRRSLLNAAIFFGGVTRQWLFDNPKMVVLERQGDLVRF